MSRTKQAVILAGGLGSRLGESTFAIPKPMMDISGRPFLDYLIAYLRRQGIEEVLLSTGHLAESIETFFGDGAKHGISIRHSRESEPLGTGGALRNCFNMLSERFFVLNGDTIFDVNLASLDSFSKANVMALRHVSDVSRYGSVTTSGTSVRAFHEKTGTGPGLISGGILCLNKVDLDLLPHGKCSIESDLLPKLSETGKLSAVSYSGYFIDIGLPETLAECRETLPHWEAKPIAFLDRDGVINHDCRHVHKIEDFVWIDGAIDAIRYLNDTGYHVVVVTNQAGIAKGKYSEQDFWKLTDWMKEELWNAGAHLDGIYHCPYHPEAIIPEYCRVSEYRKPEPGMLIKAMHEIPNTKNESFFIGNMPTDRMAAEKCDLTYYNFDSVNLYDFITALPK